MLISIIRGIIFTCITLVVLSLISFHILLRDPLNNILAEPNFIIGYINYIKLLFHGDLGISYIDGGSISTQIFAVLPATIELCVIALVLSMLIGIPIGFMGAFYPRNFIGRLIKIVASLGISLPIFWIAPIVLYFAATQNWIISAIGRHYPLYQLPNITGFGIIDMWFIENIPYKTKIIQNVLHHLILPTLVLMIVPTMEIVQHVQTRSEKILSQQYVTLAITRGWSKLRIARIILLPNVVPPLLPQFTRIFITLFAMCMLVETIFSWPGIGLWLINAVDQQDYNAISSGIIVIGLFIISINIISNSLMFVLDPLNRRGWYAQ